MGAAIRPGYLATMLTPKVTEITSLSAHRCDVPEVQSPSSNRLDIATVRRAAQKSKER